jgi:hypothetical protein
MRRYEPVDESLTAPDNGERAPGRKAGALFAAAGITSAGVLAAATVGVPSASAAPKRSLSHGTAFDPQGHVHANSRMRTNGTAGGPTTPSEAYTRAQNWVAEQVPYNQNRSANAPDSPVGPYRTDCSGFVSMAWGLGSSLTTQTLPSVSTQISSSQLEEGDILDYNSTKDPVNGSHVVMFVGWANSQHTEYTEDEEAGGLGAVQRTIAFPYDSPMDGSGSWIPYRYNNMEEGVTPPTAVSTVRTPDGKGYWILASNGAIYSYGDAQYYGGANTGDLSGSEKAVGMATTSDGKGYWILANDGAVFSFGDAAYYGGGNTGDFTNGELAVSITPDAGATGYWILTNQGGVFSFGSAPFYGAPQGNSYWSGQIGVQLVKAGSGYWVLSKSGDIYSYGSAPYNGNPGGFSGQTAVAMASSNSSNTGYWVLSAAGGIYAEGTAPYLGGANGQSYFNGMSATSLDPSADDGGYWILGNTGGIYTYGDAPFEGAGI